MIEGVKVVSFLRLGALTELYWVLLEWVTWIALSEIKRSIAARVRLYWFCCKNLL